MSLTEILTPKNTEEVKPNLFIQRRGDTYRQVYPAAWNGVINWKNFLWGGSTLKGLVFFVIILLLAFGYYTSTKSCEDFQKNPCEYLLAIREYCLGTYDDGRTFSFITNETIFTEEIEDENTNSISDTLEEIS